MLQNFGLSKNSMNKKMTLNKIKMLRWVAGVARLDKIRNEYIRGIIKIGPIVDKIVESSLRWHVVRRNEYNIVKTSLAIPDTKKGTGRPRAA